MPGVRRGVSRVNGGYTTLMNPLADSPDVTRRIKELKYEKLRRGQPCRTQSSPGLGGCWCIGVGLGGKNLPCPVIDGEFPALTAEIPL